MVDFEFTKKYVPLGGTRRYHRPGAQVLGRANRDEWCEVTVKVRRKAPLPEPTPDTPIAPAELIDKYGADAGDLDKASIVLNSLGLTVTEKNLPRRAVHVAGPTAAMEKAFGVRLLRVKHNHVLYRGRVGDVHIPKDLNGIVTGVFGLDNRPMIKRRNPLKWQAALGALPPPDQRTWFTPLELANAYQFPAGNGAGQKIAILEFGGQFIAGDLTTFLQQVALPGAPTVLTKNVVPHLSSQEHNDADAIGETMLDIEILASLCPNATHTIYFSHWSEQGWVNNLDAALSDGPSVVSISYGLSEGTDIWTQQAIDHVNDTLKELANAGVTVCVSSGDDGSDDQVGDGHAHIDFPAASPYVLAVGGTALRKSTSDEVVWFDPDGLRADGGGSTGGGVSENNPRPSWQNIDIRSVNPPHFQGRIVPDVSANAAGSTGYLVISQNNPEVSGGTSAATPLWAALIARIQQSGKLVGFLAPRLYQPTPNTGALSLGAASCNDITSGGNASGTAEGYSAGPEFDACTGWGSPNGAKLRDNLP